jgi:hypothetical protein
MRINSSLVVLRASALRNLNKYMKPSIRFLHKKKLLFFNAYRTLTQTKKNYTTILSLTLKS